MAGNSVKRVCVFCGSNNGFRPQYATAATAMAAAMVQRGLGLVYGGGNVGLMGTIADAVMRQGGKVIGVIPDALVERELAHGDVTEMIVVRSMHERKAKMAELADAFIAMPGGFGTFEEFCEIVTWAQLGLHRKPCGLLNVEGYYDPLMPFLRHGFDEQFVRTAFERMLLVSDSPAALLDAFASFEPPAQAKWMDRAST